MKKFLLGISILAFSTAANCATKKSIQTESKKPIEIAKSIKSEQAQKSKSLSCKLSGETSANHYVFKMNRKEENDGKGRGNHLAVEDSLINFEVLGNHLNHDFGYLIGVTGNAEKGNNPIKENRVMVKGFWGTLLAGDTKGVSDILAVDTLYFAGGTGGVLGNYKGVINETTGSILRTDLLDKLTPKDETKIVYLSPNFNGFQLGYSYTPDGSHRGEQKLASHSPTSYGIKTIYDDKKLSGENFHEFALKYKVTPHNDWKIDCSATAIFGKMRNLKSEFADLVNYERTFHGITNNDSIKRNNLSAYAGGLVISYKNFSIGSEIVNNRKSGQLKILDKANLGKIWTFGVGYNDDLNKVSLVYFKSKRKLGKIEDIDFGNAKANNLALTYDRQILSGMTLYVEGLLVNLKNQNNNNMYHWSRTMNGFSDDIVKSNKGKILTTGTRIKF